MHTSKPDHLRGFDDLGFHRYFLTFCTFERQPRFIMIDAVDLVMLQIQRADILENPVRAGLVRNPEDYPFSGSPLHSVAEILEAVQFEPSPRSG
jgi:hypothetical protein